MDFAVAQVNLCLGHAQGIKTVDNLPLVQEAQHHLLPVVGGQGRYADVYVLTAVVKMDAAVLRAALFGDVHARHNLEARDYLGNGTQG